MFVRESGMPEAAYWEALIDHCGLVDEMGLPTETDILEIGVGYGSFLKCFAENNNVHYRGIDLEPDMIRYVQERFSSSPAHIELFQGDMFDENFISGIDTAGLIFCFNILHHEDPAEILRICRQKLVAGGKLAIGHWRNDVVTPRGPPVEMRLGLSEAKELLQAQGMQIIRSGNSESSPHHYYVLGRVAD